MNNSIGFFLWLGVEIQHKQQVVAYAKCLPYRALTVIVLPFKGKILEEFRHRGQMYDVVRYVFMGNKIAYFCFNDIQEQQLLAIVQHGDNTEKQATSFLRNCTFFVASLTFAFFLFLGNEDFLGNNRILFFSSAAYQAPILGKDSPPPNMFL